jgi:hypothetical protein
LSCANSAAGLMIETSQSSAARTAATSRAYFWPGSSLSGQIRTGRPASGVQSVLPAAPPPPLDVVGIDFRKMLAAASAAFSPSQTTIGASRWAAIRSAL